MQLIAANPADIVEFIIVGFEFSGHCLCGKPKHQRRRKRPRLRCFILNIGDKDSGLFFDLTHHAFFKGFTRFDKPCHNRIHTVRPTALPPKQTGFSIWMLDQGNDSRVRARKCAMTAFYVGAPADMTAFLRGRRGAAPPTMQMIKVPQHHPPRIGQQRRLIDVERPDTGMQGLKNS